MTDKRAKAKNFNNLAQPWMTARLLSLNGLVVTLQKRL
ncbi:hypothetical protein SD78_2738 [Bacillus badius]|nr:hypothetical protein SD78_2738 [Bacillus badius]